LKMDMSVFVAYRGVRERVEAVEKRICLVAQVQTILRL